MWFVDALHRDHAEVEERVRAAKRISLGLLPSKSWQLNAAWVLAATLAADLDAWTRLLLLHDEPSLAAAEPETIRRRSGDDPETIRMKLYHLPARLTAHARTRALYLDRTWPWVAAFTTARQRATDLPTRT
ncbi:transposase [Streptomyces sp. NPDC048277]|uniref:transposase n=1 Tax=Streptomyces sp. NPDC048277 TaxID=3155027 RepID=UPI0033CB3152